MNETVIMGNKDSHPLCDAIGGEWKPADANCTYTSNPIGGDCANTCYNGLNNRDFTLINEQLRPIIELEQNVYQRWRFGALSSKRYLNLVITQDLDTLAASENCDLQLIAKDGIYLNSAPRLISSVILASGNRADVMVRCTEPGKYFLLSRPVRGSLTSLNTTSGGFGTDLPILGYDPLFQGIIGDIVVVEGNNEPVELVPFMPIRPPML